MGAALVACVASVALASCSASPGTPTGATPTAPTASPAPDGTYEVTVTGGFGSGRHAPGETVHVWADVSTTDEVAQPWTGDADLLEEPDEWHSTFVMPERDVSLTAETSDQELTLRTEELLGASDATKTVRYALPTEMTGVVLFSHGTGGSSSFIDSAEAFPLALALFQRGYGVIATEAEESVVGDQTGEGKERWNTRPTAGNVDLRNLEMLFDDLEARGLVPAGAPKYALGMSAGGAFSHFLGTVGDLAIADEFPQLRFDAVVSYCADATTTRSATRSTTPSAWFMCANEDNPEVFNDQARANEATMRERGIRTQYLENAASPLYDGRFTRIAGITPDTSAAMAEELRRGGFVDDAGFLDTDADAVTATIFADPTGFPTITSATRARLFQSQLKAMRAEHGMFADATQRTIAFFEDRPLPQPL